MGYAPDGPTVYEVFESWTPLLLSAWILAAICTVLTLIVWYRHWCTLRVTPYSFKKEYTLSIVRLSPIFAIATFLPLFFVRAAPLFELVRSIQEAVSIYYFVELELLLLGGLDQAATTLTNNGPKQILAVPPLCCCCRLCCPLIVPTRSVIVWCRRAAKQFMFVVPATSFLGLWFALEQSIDENHVWNGLFNMLDGLRLASAMTGLWGLMILHFACMRELAEHNVTRKLIAIKLLVLLGVVQGVIIAFTVGDTASSGNLFEKSYLAVGWENFLLCLESLMLAVILARSFPAYELEYTPLNGDSSSTSASKV